ncbi:M23 family peptidase, partial [Brachyspira hampsonii]|nr:M23 family peptidase [Brachyspira hampsonii]
MKNNKFKYTKIRKNNNIFSHIEDILFKIKSQFTKSNSIQRIRTTYVHSTRYTGKK